MPQPKEPPAHDTRITREFLVKLERNQDEAIRYLWDMVRTHTASREDFEVCMVAFHNESFQEGWDQAKLGI